MKRHGTGKIVVFSGVTIDSTVASGVLTQRVHNPYGGAAYLQITTADRTSSASLTLAVKTAFPIGAAVNLHSQLAAAITADATKVYEYGIDTSGDGTHVVESFNNPLPPDFDLEFTVASGTFTLTAILYFC